jgi:hypothetical protein
MSIQSTIDAIIAELTRRQAQALQKSIFATFLLGFKQSGTTAPLSSLQKEQIAKVYKEQMGYISQTNKAVAEEMTLSIKDIISKGGSQEQIRQGISGYISDVFGDKGITIDNIGKTRIEYEVSKDGTIRAVEKTITKKYSSTLTNYSDVVAKSVSHASLEEGRAAGYRKQGVTHWRFTGPSDERARISHIILLGNVYKYGTEQSDLAMAVLAEPRCRHRAVPFFNDKKFDTPDSHFDKMKDDAGLFWDDNSESWAIKE